MSSTIEELKRLTGNQRSDAMQEYVAIVESLADSENLPPELALEVITAVGDLLPEKWSMR